MPVSSQTNPTAVDNDQHYLRPYVFHGVDLTVRGSHATGECPFCGRGGKFSVDVNSGQWRCLVCGTGTAAGGGNGLVFTRLVYEIAAAPAQSILERLGAFYAAVASDRRLLSPATVAAWGVRPAADGTWLLPGYSPTGRLDQVYRRTRVQDKGEWVWRLLPTPGIWPDGKVHALHLAPGDYDPSLPNLFVCEGPWDGMAMWEARTNEMSASTNVVAVPGCNVWRDEWSAMCRGKEVTLWFDSDHPREHVKGRVSRAGYDGMCRIARKLNGIAASVRWLQWGPDGYDPTRPTGWDVRDHLSESTDRVGALADLRSKVVYVPADVCLQASPASSGHHAASIEAQPCSTWSECEAAWRAAMWWRTDLSDALAVLLAVCASTQQSGNQLFLDLVGSAGSGKTTLCEGLLVSGHCHHLEHLTGFHSGHRLADDPGKDCSPIARMNGKTLVTPEFDIMRSSPRYAELMGQVRRIFDGKSGATYKNTDKDTLHVGLRTPWIRAGTQAIMDTDQASMGDRFQRLIIADPSSEEEKRQIMRSALKSERVAMMDQANGTSGSLVDPKMRKAHALTGGYVDWLRANVEEQLTRVDVDDAAEERCIDLAELAADMRARPNEDKRKKEIHDTKELPTRLARQNIRMATCLAVVLNKRAVDAEVLRIVRKLALDTSHGHSLNIAQWLCSPVPGKNGRTYQECGGLMESILAAWTGMPTERLTNYLTFMRKIGILELRRRPQSNGSWLLTERSYDLYRRVMNG